MGRDLTAASDAALVVAVARSQQAGLAEAYRRHAGAVFGLARRVLYDSALAEEVVQDVFLRLWRLPERFEPERGTLRSFLLTQTHGRAVDLLRSESSRRQREVREARASATAGYDLEHEVLEATVAEQVRAALGSLPDEQRRPIELAYFGGHSYREVARILEAPEGTVKSRIRAGMQQLHEVLIVATSLRNVE